MSDDARSKILARRASFVAAALAGVACGKEPADRPQPCLSQPINTHPSGEPQVCLSVPLPVPTTASLDAGRPAPPQPCLSQVAPPTTATPLPTAPQPQPCLSQIAPLPAPAPRKR